MSACVLGKASANAAGPGVICVTGKQKWPLRLETQRPARKETYVAPPKIISPVRFPSEFPQVSLGSFVDPGCGPSHPSPAPIHETGCHAKDISLGYCTFPSFLLPKVYDRNRKRQIKPLQLSPGFATCRGTQPEPVPSSAPGPARPHAL